MKADAKNPQARKWTYGASSNTIEKARRFAAKIKAQASGIKTRIVNGETGEVLEY